MWQKYKPYIISIAIALGVGALSALLTRGSMEIYAQINQPPLAPPSWVFPVVWFVLFTLMGIGSALVYVNRSNEPESAASALKIYATNLVFNFLWSIVFFNFRAYLFAYIWLMILWVIIIVMIAKFRRVSPAAAWMQVPYLLWVTFASYLNLMIYLLNR